MLLTVYAVSVADDHAGAYLMKHLGPVEQVRGEDSLEHLPKRDGNSPFYVGIEWE